MIVVTRINGTPFALNPDLVERIHEAPDTTLVLVGGAKYIVAESMAEVISLITAYRAQVLQLARDLPPAQPAHLSVVPARPVHPVPGK